MLSAWIPFAYDAVATASAAPIAPGETPADPNSIIAHITFTLSLIVIGGIILILAQSYLGRHRHPPEWIDSLEAEEQERERQREERIVIRGTSGSEDPEAEATRQLLNRVGQLRGIGSGSSTSDEERAPITLEEVIEAARRTPKPFSEDEEHAPAAVVTETQTVQAETAAPAASVAGHDAVTEHAVATDHVVVAEHVQDAETLSAEHGTQTEHDEEHAEAHSAGPSSEAQA